MTPDQRDLAAKLVELPGWDWQPGMLTHTTVEGGFPVCRPGTPIRIENESCFDDLEAEQMVGCACSKEDCERTDYGGRCGQFGKPPALPDISDPATAGLLLQMVPGLIEVHAAAGAWELWFMLDTMQRAWGEALGEACARACIAAGRCA